MSSNLWQLYDEQGRAITPHGATKHEAVIKGLLHGAVHVWMWQQNRAERNILVQKRAGSKLNWPGMLDKSAGGHIRYGEEPTQAAIRKAREELGIWLTANDLQLMGITRWHHKLTDLDLYENEFQWIFMAELDNAEFAPAEDQVESVEWVPLQQMKRDFTAQHSSPYVPYDDCYFTLLFQAVKQARPRMST